MEGSVEDALKGLEKVHMTIPKPQQAKIGEKKNPRKPKIFKGESYKVRFSDLGLSSGLCVLFDADPGLFSGLGLLALQASLT